MSTFLSPTVLSRKTTTFHCLLVAQVSTVSKKKILSFRSQEDTIKMANSLFLSTSLLHPAQTNREVSASATTLSKLSISFNGKVIGHSNFNQRETHQSCRSRKLTVFSLFRRKSPVKTKRETVVPDPDYRIPIILLGAAGGLAYSDNLVAAVPVGLLGLLLLVQATRVRFVFDDEALAVKVGSELKESGENVFVGGKNRWKYSTFVNWEFWWPKFPVLVYFKETQTKPEGQIHFFPIIFNGKQLYDVMVERAGPTKTSGPK